MLNQFQIRRVVFNIQHGAAGQLAGVKREMRPGVVISVGESGRLGKCKLNPEGAAFTELARHADGAAHQLDEVLGHHQPDAGALLGGGFLAYAVERLKQLRDLFRRKTFTRIANAHANGLRIAQRTVDHHRATGKVVLDGVEKQIDEHLLDAGSVGLHVAGYFELRKADADASLLCLRLDHGATFE